MEQKKTNKVKNTNKKSHKKMTKDKYTKIAFIVILAAIILSVVSYGIWHIYINTYYSSYKEKMEWYELNKLYDNDKANSTEKVYNSEIAKLTLGLVLNVTNEDYMVKYMNKQYNKTLPTNEAWLKYASYYDITGINVEDFENKASKVDAAIYLVQAIEAFLKQEIKITETLKEKLIDKVDNEKLENINKAISIGILENNRGDITDKTLIKGEYNKMLITVLEKYNTVYYKSLYNLNTDGANIVTDKEKLPINYTDYPYIIDIIDKEIYELTTDEMTSTISETPKKVYDVYKDEYSNTSNDIIEYFDIILNVNYNNINKEKFIDELNQYCVYNLEVKANGEYLYKNDIEEYVDYVIDNRIILKGKATPLLPIIYSNGLVHFLRTKIEFTIENSNTNENLLLWDRNTTYKGNKIEVYVDVPVSPTYYSKAFRIFNAYSLMKYIVKTDGNVEVK